MSEVTEQTNSSLGCIVGTANCQVWVPPYSLAHWWRRTREEEHSRPAGAGELWDPVDVYPCVCQEIPDYRSLHKTEMFPLYVGTINIVYQVTLTSSPANQLLPVCMLYMYAWLKGPSGRRRVKNQSDNTNFHKWELLVSSVGCSANRESWISFLG